MTLHSSPKPAFTALSIFVLACAASLAAAAQSLDYEVFKTKVEPILPQKRPSHALRSVPCGRESYVQPVASRQGRHYVDGGGIP
jgi:hypothetical protein